MCGFEILLIVTCKGKYPKIVKTHVPTSSFFNLLDVNMTETGLK